MTKVLITGGAGFIGSHLAEKLQSNCQVVILDDLSSGNSENLRGIDCDFIEGSILNRDLVEEAVEGCSRVFHLAAMVSVAESMKAPRECLEQNVSGLLNVLDACVKYSVGKLVFASSAAVYGNTPQSPKAEDQLPAPESPYAITKLDGEHYLEIYRKVHGLKSAAPRFFNVYGPRQNPAGDYAAAVPIFFEKALANQTITVFGDGEQTRDFIHVSDVVAGIQKSAEEDAINGPFNLACGSATSINDLISRILTITGSASKVIHQEVRPGDIKHSLADVSKASEFGISSGVALQQGLLTMI
ncbi:NAD-dependent epimerase/dehydratase family protein [Akkermansiaceae bacterium]|nr:NAD-dependent epimerase/dehydratase family protein [Akkermansiaceae bacterium]